MTAKQLLTLFLILRFAQYLAEKRLAKLNRAYYSDARHQQHAIDTLQLASDDMIKSFSYAEDRYRFGLISGWIRITLMLAFLAIGGLGWIEQWAITAAGGSRPILTGLYFFAILGAIATLMNLPFAFYNQFVIEQKHGFNKQTVAGFCKDIVKGLLISVILGGLLLSLLLWIMQRAGVYWWIWAWITVSGFGIITAWLYPTFLAPLFNKFTPLPEGELKQKIFALAERVRFAAAGLFVMDASVRSTHGNAYFTGVFGKKRIVLFDTLIEMLNADEVVAVLAHELGHFKLHHVRWMLIRSTLMTGLTMYLLSLCIPLEVFYRALGLDGIRITEPWLCLRFGLDWWSFSCSPLRLICHGVMNLLPTDLPSHSLVRTKTLPTPC